MSIEPWFVIAVACNVTGYFLYLVGLRRQLVEPNRASWLIWSAATGIEAVTYTAVNPGTLQSIVFLVSAICCAAVTLGVWRQSAWSTPNRIESLCMGVCLLALMVWMFFQSAFWAHMLVIVAVPISFLPTWQSVWEDRTRERSPSWGLWAIGDLATLIVAMSALRNGFDEIAYVFVELVCHASIWFMIGFATINPLRSFGFRNGRFYILDVDKSVTNMFVVGKNHLGKAVYAALPFAAGATVIEFTGPRLAKSNVPNGIAGPSDRWVQIGEAEYLGPSGGIDDLINHSCDPNAGLRFADGKVFLVALRDIAEGEEISWDYSTTLAHSGWHMICHCKSRLCRRVIGDFETIDAPRQAWYRAHNLVAPYLRSPEPAPPPQRRAGGGGVRRHVPTAKD